MPHNVLVLGGTGMLGSMTVSVLRRQKGVHVEATQRISTEKPLYFDALGAEPALRDILAAKRWDYLINCIGITPSGIDEQDPASIERARLVNARLPERLAEMIPVSGTRVIHMSTDGVFSGDHGPYDESAAPHPGDVYGKTKLAGEIKRPGFLILRCSLIGPDPSGKRGLFEWFRSQKPGARVRGYTDHWWNGATTRQFADLCRLIIAAGSFESITARSSLRHFCPNKPVTKFQLLEIFKNHLNLPVTVYPERSGRPVNRALASRWNDFKTLFGQDRDIEMADAVAEMLESPVAS
ncbi:MAG: sugar nucleotide-binding protein [Elusimicrobiota bacterium]